MSPVVRPAEPTLTALLRALGAELHPDPVPMAVPQGGTEVGRLGGLPVWLSVVDARDGMDGARRLARRGIPGLVIAAPAIDGARRPSVDVVADFGVAAITVQPVRAVPVPLHDPDALVWQRLARVASVRRATALEQAIAMADALDVDAAGRRTFRLLHRLLERGIGMLPPTMPREDRHAWVLTQLIRLVFLRFVESEGWLAGNPRFLGQAFDRCLLARKDPTRHLLHPLFFGTLNREPALRTRFARGFGEIPFLNGGLFEQHAVERRHRRAHLPVEFWCGAFADLVDRIDVSLQADPHGDRVTPELLGRVFEGVMDPAERKRDGTFFTPPVLVAAVLREALACHLAPRLGRSETATLNALTDPDAALRRMLLDVTVLDPAVGSGAFLVEALAALHGPGERRLARVRHLVTRRLFGIDRHPGAVRICELRLWLEVLRAMRGMSARAMPPLPNLDTTIRAGNALLDPFGMHDATMPTAMLHRLRRQQRVVLMAHGAAKRAALADIRRTERDSVLLALNDRLVRLDGVITELLTAARAPTLLGERQLMDRSARRQLEVARRERTEIRRDIRHLLRDTSSAPFAAAAAFASVLQRRSAVRVAVEGGGGAGREVRGGGLGARRVRHRRGQSAVGPSRIAATSDTSRLGGAISLVVEQWIRLATSARPLGGVCRTRLRFAGTRWHIGAARSGQAGHGELRCRGTGRVDGANHTAPRGGSDPRSTRRIRGNHLSAGRDRVAPTACPGPRGSSRPRGRRSSDTAAVVVPAAHRAAGRGRGGGPRWIARGMGGGPGRGEGAGLDDSVA